MQKQRQYKRPFSKGSKPIAPSTDGYGHIQPQEIEMEQAVIGALLIEREAYFKICEILKPESFYEPKHQLIYEAIRQLYLEERPVDILTVADQLRKTDNLEKSGGEYYLVTLSRNVHSSAHIDYHSRIIAQKALARNLISYASNITTKAFDATQDVAELMQEAQGELFEMAKNNLKKDYTQIDPVVKDAYEGILKASKNSDGMSGIASGYTELDKITRGWQNSDLVILAARPAMGKTAFALSMAKNMAIDNRVPIAFFSLEMSNVQLVNRIISNVTEIASDKIRSGQLEPYDWGQLDRKIKQLYGAPLFVDDTPQLSVYDLMTKARRLKREHGIKAIMIDYLQLMNASGMDFGSRQEEVAKISRSLKGLAKELEIPILALSQLNRGVESREGNEGKRPQLSDLRESGAIEQDADMVLFIHRPEYYRIYQDEHGRDLRGKAEIIIAKHRNGAVGDIKLKFVGQYARFQNVEDESDIPMPGEDTIISKMNTNEPDDFPPPPTDVLPY